MTPQRTAPIASGRGPLARLLAPLLAGASALLLYGWTLAPGLTWAHSSADGGDLLAAALTRGVPHPTGYPTYQILLRAAIALHGGEPARAGAWLSALAAALAAGLLADLGQRVLAGLGRPPTGRQRVAAGLAALAWAASPAVWGQATVTEVYALNALFAVGLLWLAWRWAAARAAGGTGRGWLAAGGLALGLGLGNHVSLVLLLPGLVAWWWSGRVFRAEGTGMLDAGMLDAGMLDAGSEGAGMLDTGSEDAGMLDAGILSGGRRWRRPQSKDASARFTRFDARLPDVLFFAAALLLGLAVYAYLPLAAAGRPPVNWGDPTTPARLWWAATGRLYAGLLFGLPLAELPARTLGWASEALRQFGGPWGFLLALFGLWRLDVAHVAQTKHPERRANRRLAHRRERSRRSGLVDPVYRHAWWRVTMLVALAYTIVGIGYNTTDSYVYLLPAWAALAPALGAGIEWILDKAAVAGRGRGGVRRSGKILTGIAVALLALLLVGASLAANWRTHDLSRDAAARDWVAAALAEAEPRAVIVSAGDRTTFALWYAVYGLGQRPDVALLNANLFGFDWYRATLRETHADVFADLPEPPPALEALLPALAADRPLYRADELALDLPGLREAPGDVLVRYAEAP